MDDATRRKLALFPIGIVQKLTDLTARQIRYYEQHGLIRPERTEGNQRLFSFNDVERLLEIKSLIDKGLNIAGIKAVMNSPRGAEERRSPELGTEPFHGTGAPNRDLSEAELHDFLMQELSARVGFPGGPASIIQGELSRFFHKER